MLSVTWWSILSDSLDGVPRRFLFLTDRRFGFFTPFPLFHANDRVVTTPLEGIADLSVLKRADGVGDVTFVGEWSRPEPRFSGPCTIYDVENVEDLGRTLAEAAGIEPTISKG